MRDVKWTACRCERPSASEEAASNCAGAGGVAEGMLDRRAARLGILALVATLLLGAIGARLWFLQTVQAESLQQTVDASKTKTVRLLPERGASSTSTGASSPTTSAS